MTQLDSLLALRNESLWKPQKHTPSLKMRTSAPSVSEDNAKYYDDHLKGSIGC